MAKAEKKQLWERWQTGRKSKTHNWEWKARPGQFL